MRCNKWQILLMKCVLKRNGDRVIGGTRYSKYNILSELFRLFFELFSVHIYSSQELGCFGKKYGHPILFE
jgi:hypothetical protein